MKIMEKSREPTINIAIDTLAKGKQALIFVGTKRSAEKQAEDIAKKIKETKNKWTELSSQVLKALSHPTKQCERLAKVLKKGIAFHHAGLASKQRELIEDNFRSGVIKIICATPTLCISGDTKIWHGAYETKVTDFKRSKSVYAISNGNLIGLKPQKIQKITNFSKLIKISSVAGHSIKVTPNHRMVVKRNNKRIILYAKDIKKSDKIATVGKLTISKTFNPHFDDFTNQNLSANINYKFGPKLSYFIGVMLGDGYSGIETKNGKIVYKGSPSVVGIDDEIFSCVKDVCTQLRISCRETKTFHGTPQLVLGKNKWFREFLVRCGVEKRDKKHISDKLLRLKLESTTSLLRGLFDTDGYVEKKSGPGFSNISEKLVRQVQKMLLRYGVVSRIRSRKGGLMKIYDKEYKTVQSYELSIHQKKSIINFYKYVGFNLKRKQKALVGLVDKIISNINYFSCKNCGYKMYKDVFAGRTKDHNKWGQIRLNVIKLLGKKGELSSRELKKILCHEVRNKENRLNHHYYLIRKRKIGRITKTDWFWSLNEMGKWIFDNLINKNKSIDSFFLFDDCPLCNNHLEKVIKKGHRDSDFDRDIFWDKIRRIDEVECENEVYDVVLPIKPKNDHLFVAEGFIIHNSMGVDLPAFRTVVKDVKRYGAHGLSYIPVLEYQQMSGRAGRPGKEDFGEAILIATTDVEKEELTERYVHGEPEEIYSKLAVEPVLRTYVLSLISAGFVRNQTELLDFFSKTFWAQQYGDMQELEKIINKVIAMLQKFEFIESSKGDEFRSASDIIDEKLKPTLVGKRVSELYIDPLTANYFIENLSKKEKARPIAYLHLVSHTNELRPFLRVKTSELNEINESLMKDSDELLEKEPRVFDPDYDDFLNSYKTALMLQDWTNEKDEEYILETYSVRPGELKAKLDLADWLMYSASEIAKLKKIKVTELNKLRIRLKNGVKEELIPLLKLKGIGRRRARKLYNNKIKDLGYVKKVDVGMLAMLLGSGKLAKNVKEQVGQKVKGEVKEVKRGQQKLHNY